jgi:hypothetical protein
VAASWVALLAILLTSIPFGFEDFQVALNARQKLCLAVGKSFLPGVTERAQSDLDPAGARVGGTQSVTIGRRGLVRARRRARRLILTFHSFVHCLTEPGAMPGEGLLGEEKAKFKRQGTGARCQM